MNGLWINISGAATAIRSGVSAKMIRHYEQIDLLPIVRCSDTGYRTYTHNDVHTLHFVRQARNLGFSFNHSEDRLALWRNQHRPSSQVKALALAHVAELDKCIGEFETMKHARTELAVRCHGDGRPECPIPDALASNPLPAELSAATKTN